MFYMWLRLGKPDPCMLCNGLLAGLVAITAPCAFVNSVSAVIIGVIAGVLVVDPCSSSTESRRSTIRSARFRCTVSTARGACSRSGCSRTVLRRRLERCGRHGDGPLLRRCQPVRGAVRRVAHLHGVRVRDLLRFFKVVDAVMGNRVAAEVELEGLDIPEMGALAYPDFVLGPGTPLAPIGLRCQSLLRRRRHSSLVRGDAEWRERPVPVPGRPSHMKLVKCIVRPDFVAEVTAALERSACRGITVTDVRGRGRTYAPGRRLSRSSIRPLPRRWR